MGKCHSWSSHTRIRYLDNRDREILCCEQERGNLEDPYIVSVMKGDTKLSTFCIKSNVLSWLGTMSLDLHDLETLTLQNII